MKYVAMRGMTPNTCTMKFKTCGNVSCMYKDQSGETFMPLLTFHTTTKAGQQQKMIMMDIRPLHKPNDTAEMR